MTLTHFRYINFFFLYALSAWTKLDINITLYTGIDNIIMEISASVPKKFQSRFENHTYLYALFCFCRYDGLYSETVVKVKYYQVFWTLWVFIRFFVQSFFFANHHYYHHWYYWGLLMFVFVIDFCVFNSTDLGKISHDGSFEKFVWWAPSCGRYW